MSGESSKTVVLVGNPNSGKTTLFNALTGLNQRTGNFAGVTVEKKEGHFLIEEVGTVVVIDYPGTYSIYPKSEDERIVFDMLLHSTADPTQKVYIVVTDASNLKRNLLLFSQIQDLGVPCILALNMMDVVRRRGVELNTRLLENLVGVPVVELNSRSGEGIELLKTRIKERFTKTTTPYFFHRIEKEFEIAEKVSSVSGIGNMYANLLVANNMQKLSHLERKVPIQEVLQQYQHNPLASQAKETVLRYDKIEEIVAKVWKSEQSVKQRKFTNQLDKWAIHPIFGYAILLIILLGLFEAIFSFATVPMDWFDENMGLLSMWLLEILPPGFLTNFLIHGVLAGITGVLIFIPQISILFFFITLLEESGYMARVMFLLDQIMRQFGLNGKSIVPLFSGTACAIPAIMSARNIGSAKERLITIFVTPIISCSARIPVYTTMIALIIPSGKAFGVIHYQGLTLFLLYAVGFVVALITSLVLHRIIKEDQPSFFILEMPDYKMPKIKNILILIWIKIRSFVSEAGKIILILSVLIWFLSTYGPNHLPWDQGAMEEVKIEESYAAMLGKTIEPAIRPLGFDWKIGIALITSFAAREVFVGTISVIYSIGGDADDQTMRSKLASQKDDKGNTYFNFARGISILLFYAFALQCISTIAIVRQETGSWKFALIQLLYLSCLSYLLSLAAFQMLK